MTLLIAEQDVEKILSIKDAIPIIEDVFRMSGRGSAENPPRYRMPFKAALRERTAKKRIEKSTSFALTTRS